MNLNPRNPSPIYLGWRLAMNRLNAQLGINVFRYEKDRHKRNVKKTITVVIVICLLVLSLYCGLAAYGYGTLGMEALVPGIAMVISSLINLFFTIFKANGELYGFRDYELVLSLPIPITTVIHSRLFNMYFWNTVITVLVMAPMRCLSLASLFNVLESSSLTNNTDSAWNKECSSMKKATDRTLL